MDSQRNQCGGVDGAGCSDYGEQYSGDSDMAHEQYSSDGEVDSYSDELSYDGNGPQSVEVTEVDQRRDNQNLSAVHRPGAGAASTHLVQHHPTAGPARPIGGAVSTQTTHISKHATGDQALELFEAYVRRGEQSSYNTTVETGSETKSDVKEVHVHLTQTNIHNPASIALGGRVVVNPPREEMKPKDTPVPPTAMQKLRCETERNFEMWTEGMIKTRATQAVLDKISQGRTWITITGSPGEGKTTAGYLVLKHLHNQGRQVYDIKIPEDYFKVKDAKQPVIMLNDIFGSLQFDNVKVKKWEEVLSDILGMKEHKREKENNERGHKKPRLTVILISRSSVLKAASHHLGRFRDLVLKEESIVDITHGFAIAAEERMKIWKCNTGGYNIDIADRVIKELCQLSLPHGFPHCCRLFAALYSKNKHVDVMSFFAKPIQFLNQTMESLMMDAVTGRLLREILAHEGQLDLNTVRNEERRFQYTAEINKLRGTYLSQDGSTVTFHHPSVYDSAAFVVCKNEPVFVLENCSLSFLNDRVRLDGLALNTRSQGQPTFTIDHGQIPIFLKRLTKEFEADNLADTLSHGALNDEGFALLFIKSILQTQQCQSILRNLMGFVSKQFSMSMGVRNLIQRRDRNSKQSLLFLITKGGSEKILKNVCQNIELSQEEQMETFFGICTHGAVSAMAYFLQKYRKFDINVKSQDLQTPLLLASKTSSEYVLKRLLEKNVDVKARDKKGNSALHNICRHGIDGDGDVVKILMDKGADASEECAEYPYSPLHIACHEGQRNVVDMLLQTGAEVNTCDRNGDTPLIHACEMSHREVVTLLLDRGADINIMGNAGNTPLHNTCYLGHGDVVIVLLDRGADVNSRNIVDDNPIHSACYGGHVDVLSILLERGADIDQTGSDGDTPLHKACYRGLEESVSALIDRGADINKTNRDGDVPLHTACYWGHVNILQVLSDKGADINKTDSAGNTALHNACLQSQVSVVTALIDIGAAINKVNIDDDTPLHSACDRGHVNVMNVLLDRGANVNKPGSNGDAPLHRASYAGHVDIVTGLLDRGADANKTNSDGDTPLHKACLAGQMGTLTVLLDRGADINRTNGASDTPLHKACHRGHVDIVTVISERGANIHKIDGAGNTALHRASHDGQAEVVTALLDKGADVNSTSAVDDTPLHCACYGGNGDIVFDLLERGANINMIGSDGYTPLHRACYKGHVDVVLKLIYSGADMSLLTFDGHTPLEIARNWGHSGVVAALLQREELWPTDTCLDRHQYIACYDGYHDVA